MKRFLTGAVLAGSLAVLAVPVAATGLSGAYLAARQATQLNDFAEAARYYTMALTRDSDNPRLMENVVLSQVSLGALDRALPVAQVLDAQEQPSQIGQMVTMAGLAKEGNFEEILARIDAKKGVGPLVDGLLKGWAYLGAGAMSDALVAFDAVAGQRGLRGFAHYHKALALASVGDFEGAEAIYADSKDGAAAQMTRRGVLARVEVLSQLDRNDDALALIRDSFGDGLDPSLADIRDRLEAGEALPFTHVTTPRDGVAELFYSVAGALNAEGADDNYTLLYTRIAEWLRPDHIDALLLSASLLEQMERYDLAAETYRRVPGDDLSFHVAELGRAESLRKSGKVDAAIEVLQQLTRSHGDIAIVHTTLGDTMRQQERWADAVSAYDKALALQAEDAAGSWFIHYARAICHERLDHWEQAESDFRRALELNPDQPQVLNYLGYSLVEKQEKLDEALDMIERAVAARPDSGYIVDSLGWVLYRLGRYDESIVHMERAAELMPVDPVVNDHLGDVLWAVGRELEARFQWKRALSFITEDSDLDEVKPDRIRRKLQVGLDAVLSEEGAPPLKLANDDG